MAANNIMFLDLETENHEYFGALASPRNPANYVVMNGYAVESTPYSGKITVYYYPENHRSNWLHIPDDVWLLVVHNAPFEMDWFLVQQRDELLRFLARGGRIFDTAYGHYLLSNQQETYPALDEIAPRYGGTHKVDGVKLLWEQGYKTSQIDPALLAEYLGGPNGDVANTRLCFYGQYEQLVARGMWNMAMVRMEGLLFNCFAMNAGLKVDRAVAFAQMEASNKRLAELQQEFRKMRAIPEYAQFKESSDYHMSAWLFGGPIKYAIQDTWYEEDGVTPKYVKADYYKFGDKFVLPERVATPEGFEICVTAYGAPVRYASGKNKGQLKVFREDTTQVKVKWYERLYFCEPLVDINLLPKDLQKSFKYDFAGARKLADGTPVYSTGKDCIEMLSKRPEFPEAVRNVLTCLLEFAKIDKDVSTYYMRDKLDADGNVVKTSGMLQYLTPDDFVYHILNATATVTGRLSSNRPNMQNIPRGDTSDVKRMFVSRFGADGVIIEADYSALEVVTLAAFSKDSALVKALLEGTDMHCMRLSKKLNEPYESVLLKVKDENHPEHAEYKKMRTDIKPPSFAYQYGATAQGIAFATGCSVEYAEEFIANEKALFPEVEAFYENVIFKEVEASSVLRREQTGEGQFRMYKTGVYVSPGKTHYEFRQHEKTVWDDQGGKHVVMQYKPTQMRNYPIQGESGYFVQGIAGLIVRWLISRNFYDGRVFIINQVHDAVYLDCHKDVLDEVARTVKQIMESLPQYFNSTGYDLQVPFPAEVEYGPNMLEKHKLH